MHEDRLDELIREVVTEEMESIEITDEEIEIEWKAFCKKRKKIQRKSFYKKISFAAAIIILSFIIITPFMAKESYSWKIFKVLDISNYLNKKTIRDTSSQNEINNDAIENKIEVMEVSIDDAKDILSFKFKQLPYNPENVIVIGENKIVINYKTQEGRIKLTQKLQGIESSETIDISKDSEIETLKINGIKYNYINIENKICKIIWKEYGIDTLLEVKYHITKDEAKKLIKLLN